MSAGGLGGGGGRSVLALGVFVVACSPLGTPPTTVPGSTTVTTPGSTTTVAPTTTTAAPTTTLAPCVPPAFELTPVDVTSGHEVQLGVADVAYAFGEPPSGPNAVTVGPDGTVWIADTEALRLGTPRLLRIGCDGAPGTIIDLSRHQIASAVDVVADRTTVWVADFDVARDVYRVMRLDSDGLLVGEYEIPEGFRLFDGFTGLELSPDGSLLLEKVGVETFVFVSPDGTVLDPPTPWTWIVGDHPVTLENPQPTSGNEGAVVIGDLVVPIVTTHVLGGITWLGAGPDGEVFVVVTELYDGPVLKVDQTVWRLSTEGDVSGKARVPLAERFLYLEHPLAVTPDGHVMLMLALEEQLVVRPMEFVPELEPILPEE